MYGWSPEPNLGISLHLFLPHSLLSCLLSTSFQPLPPAPSWANLLTEKLYLRAIDGHLSAPLYPVNQGKACPQWDVNTPLRRMKLASQWVAEAGLEPQILLSLPPPPAVASGMLSKHTWLESFVCLLVIVSILRYSHTKIYLFVFLSWLNTVSGTAAGPQWRLFWSEPLLGGWASARHPLLLAFFFLVLTRHCPSGVLTISTIPS